MKQVMVLQFFWPVPQLLPSASPGARTSHAIEAANKAPAKWNPQILNGSGFGLPMASKLRIFCMFNIFNPKKNTSAVELDQWLLSSLVYAHVIRAVFGAEPTSVFFCLGKCLAKGLKTRKEILNIRKVSLELGHPATARLVKFCLDNGQKQLVLGMFGTIGKCHVISAQQPSAFSNGSIM